MATKPTKFPLWNTNELNNVEPSADRQTNGWTITSGIPEKPPVEWHNYIWNLQYKWFAYLDEIVDEKNSKFGIDTGVADALQIDNVDYTALIDDMIIEFTPANANIGATTLQVKALGAKNVFYGGVALTAGFLSITSVYRAVYSVTNNRFDIDIVANKADLDAAGISIASTAEAQAGTDDTKAITPLKLHEAMFASVKQAWTDVVGSRALSTTYTNNTGRPIEIQISYSSTSGTASLLVNVSGESIKIQTTAPTGGAEAAGSIVIPDGATYNVTVPSGTPTLIAWHELR